MRRLPNFVGQHFGRLQVLSLVESGTKNKYYECLCDCGNITIVRHDRFTAKVRPARSCGCITRDRLSTSCDIMPRRALYNVYLREAKNRDLVFKISFDLFCVITTQNCYYCGCKPNQIYKGGYNSMGNRNYTYNGIDRSDNSIGYIKTNVVPCCKWCNYSKGNRDSEEFKS